MLYPLPAVMVSVRGKNGEDNIITVAWAGTVCTNPPMVSISVRPERYSYQMIKESGAFVINLTTEDLCYATDYCGVRSGRDVDKFKEMNLTAMPGEKLTYAPVIAESPKSAAKTFAIHPQSLFQVDNYRDLANRIDYWIEHPEERTEYEKRYSQKGQEYNIEACVLRMEEMFQEAINECNTGRPI